MKIRTYSKKGETSNCPGGPLWVKEIIQGVQEGMRHDSAIRLVGRWYGLGLCTEEVILALITWNEQNRPPLGNREFMSIIKSTLHWACPR